MINKRTEKQRGTNAIAKRRKKSAQGAVRVDNKKRYSLSFNVNTNWLDETWSDFDRRYIVLGLIITVMIVVLYASSWAMMHVKSVSVDNVSIKADLKYQPAEQIREIIHQATDKGFVSVNIQDLHNQLAALPWIYQVNVQRQLPNGLLIELHEQEVIARWNDDAFINQYGEVFMPQEPIEIKGLLHFSGKKHDEVIKLYQEAKELLHDVQMPVMSFAVDSRHVVTLTMAGDSRLIVKREDMHEQLTRWKSIVNLMLRDKVDEIKQADLRYSNGVAVSWKSDVDKTHSQQLGNT